MKRCSRCNATLDGAFCKHCGTVDVFFEPSVEFDLVAIEKKLGQVAISASDAAKLAPALRVLMLWLAAPLRPHSVLRKTLALIWLLCPDDLRERHGIRSLRDLERKFAQSHNAIQKQFQSLRLCFRQR